MATSDKLMMYASVFLYKKALRAEYMDYQPSIQSYESASQIPQGSSQIFSAFLNKSDAEQRKINDEESEKPKSEELFRLLFSIVENVKGDQKLITFALILIDGILEERRLRIKTLVGIQKAHKQERKMDLVAILLSFLVQNNQPTSEQRDLAVHILSKLIEALEFKNCEKESKEFLQWLIHQNSKPTISEQALTFALMYLLKSNELAREFYDKQGFDILSRYLEKQAIQDHQIAYNVICLLWIVSYHHFAITALEDNRLNLIEKVSHILDFFNKEKIVRIILMLFDNIKTHDGCLEQMADINITGLLIKLQNRHWVDKDITDMLDKLFEYMEYNLKVFSSIEKFRKEVHKGSLKWGFIHTEKFWQENHMFFDDSDNLNLIKELIKLVEKSDDRTKAIACYDLGEFARFFAHGRSILDNFGAKEKIIEVMGKPGSSAELKKEAITCYQKMLMTTWSDSSKP